MLDSELYHMAAAIKPHQKLVKLLARTHSDTLVVANIGTGGILTGADEVVPQTVMVQELEDGSGLGGTLAIQELRNPKQLLRLGSADLWKPGNHRQSVKLNA